MYAVIRTGGKQYRVAPGDVLQVEKVAHDNGAVEFSEVLAASGQPGEFGNPAGAKVMASVVEEGRGDKVLVFHFKRKKQYKKLQGHRQAFTRIKINEIIVDGQSYKA
jgi:large subunit ribosomal protein L21